MAKLFAAVTIACGTAAAGVVLYAAIQNQSPRRVFRDRVDVVRLDVSVLDEDGRPIRGLTPGDFTIRDKGRDYEPVFFEAVEIPMVVGTDETWVGAVAPDVSDNRLADDGRLIVILLDDAALAGVTARSIQQSREVARTVVEQLAPTDLAAVVFSGDESGAQNFTNDKVKLFRAIERLHPGFVGQTPLPGAAFNAVDTDEHHMRGSIRTLRFVAEALVEAPARRKALVYISAGVPVRFDDPDDDKADDAREVFERAQRANVAIYSFNPHGLQVTSEMTRVARRGERRAALSREYLQVMAENTGGFSVVNVNNPASSVRRVFEENSVYYLIGYVPGDRPAPGEFRSIDVRVARDDVTVRARDGYFTPKPQHDVDELSPADVAMREALTALLPSVGLRMRMHVAPVAISGSDRAALVITAEIERRDAVGANRPVDLVITAYDDRGRGRASKRHTARLVTGDGGTFEIVTRLDVEPGRYEIRLAGHDAASNLSGSVFSDLEVPDFSGNGIRLSDIFLSVAGLQPAEPRDSVGDLLPIVPTTRRGFARDDEVTALVRVHQGGGRSVVDVHLSVTILASDGTVVLDDVRSVAASAFTDRQSDVRIALPLSSLSPGAYLLGVSLVGTDAQEGRRHVRFNVR